MKRIGFAALLAFTGVAILASLFPNTVRAAAVVADQIILQMTFANGGPQAKGAGVLQIGQVNTLTAAVASATRAEVVAAPAAGSIYLRALLVEKATASTGSVTVSLGTGTNCGTGTVVVAGPIIVPLVGNLPLGIQLTAAKALCLTTDGAGTSVRALAD